MFFHLLQQLVAWKRGAKNKKMEKKGNAKEVGWFLVRNFDFCARLWFSSLKLNVNVKLEDFRVVNNILGKVDPRMARRWHKCVQNAILWKKNAKVEAYQGFLAFCCKKHEIFTNPVFKNPAICIYKYSVYVYIKYILWQGPRRGRGLGGFSHPTFEW